MLNEVFISKIMRDCIEKYASEYEGKTGLATHDVISEVICYGGDYDDV